MTPNKKATDRESLRAINGTNKRVVSRVITEQSHAVLTADRRVTAASVRRDGAPEGEGLKELAEANP
jgi:hypothetical protein